jgi:predicted CxxxxCH...CXXCH cytochrome family protein
VPFPIQDAPSLRLTALLLAVLAAACGKARSSGGEASGCQACHGSGDSAAPPLGLRGETATTALAVGAHQAHLADSEFRKAVACGDCHVVPASLAGHGGKAQATLTFSALATQGGRASWNRATATCSNVYCHGDTLRAGGTGTRPVWNADPTFAVECGTCHALPPAGHLTSVKAVTDCHACHQATVKPDGTIDVAAGHHIDGKVDVSEPATLACGTCHGAPPADQAHAAHVRLGGLTGVAYGQEWITADKDPSGALGAYSFGCALCHPVDAGKHGNGVIEVDLAAATAVTGGLKARNGALASYDKASGTCSNVYCHSSGQATPTFRTSPGWASGTRLTCKGCHDDPPSYPNGGAGTASANSHLFLNASGSESGHFAGLPGPVHGSRHGNPAAPAAAGSRASPMTCQTCHADTVDPANVADGGFFYLDSEITTTLPGASPARLTQAAWKSTQCVTCHDGTVAPKKAGKVRPLHHVDGKRDVVFDRRAAPPASWLFGSSLDGPNKPSRPYFMTGAAFPPVAVTLPSDAGFDGTTLSYALTGADYLPATMTCSAVACHLGKTVRWGQKDFETPIQTCTGCHGVP